MSGEDTTVKPAQKKDTRKQKKFRMTEQEEAQLHRYMRMTEIKTENKAIVSLLEGQMALWGLYNLLQDDSENLYKVMEGPISEAKDPTGIYLLWTNFIEALGDEVEAIHNYESRPPIEDQQNLTRAMTSYAMQNDQLVRELKRVGNNLNQIARRANKGQNVYVNEVIDNMNELDDTLHNFSEAMVIWKEDVSECMDMLQRPRI